MEAINSVFSFLGLNSVDSLESILDFKDNANNQWVPLTAGTEIPIGTISSNNINSWQVRLSNLEIQYIEHICNTMLNQLGYSRLSKQLNTQEFLDLSTNFYISNLPVLNAIQNQWLTDGSGYQGFPDSPFIPNK